MFLSKKKHKNFDLTIKLRYDNIIITLKALFEKSDYIEINGFIT